MKRLNCEKWVKNLECWVYRPIAYSTKIGIDRIGYVLGH